jgi:small subunit ribosomal protein S15
MQVQPSNNMSKVTRVAKASIVRKAQIHEKDSGSVEVQVAILTQDITNLTGHLQTNKKDFSSRRGLLKKVGRRRKLLRYLQTVSPARYKKTLSANGLKDK